MTRERKTDDRTYPNVDEELTKLDERAKAPTTLKKKFIVEITSPCGRAGYDGGETVLFSHDKKTRFFGAGEFMASFEGVKDLNDGDEIEITIAVTKRAS